MTGQVLPFRPRNTAATWAGGRFVPEQPDRLPGHADHVELARDRPVTPAYCRHPQCPAVVSVEHPLREGWLHTVTCTRHHGTTENRYARGGGGLFG